MSQITGKVNNLSFTQDDHNIESPLEKLLRDKLVENDAKKIPDSLIMRNLQKVGENSTPVLTKTKAQELRPQKQMLIAKNFAMKSPQRKYS